MAALALDARAAGVGATAAAAAARAAAPVAAGARGSALSGAATSAAATTATGSDGRRRRVLGTSSAGQSGRSAARPSGPNYWVGGIGGRRFRSYGQSTVAFWGTLALPSSPMERTQML